MIGVCECGCGRRTDKVKQTWNALGRTKGRYNRFIQGHNARRGRNGQCPHGHVLKVVGQDKRGECRACQRARTAAFHAANPHYATARNRLKTLRKYDLTEAQFEALEQRQGGCCAICRQPPRPKRGVVRLHIDHDHHTRRVRGLLCWHCNWTMGKCGDSADWLRRAANYLDGLDTRVT